MERLSVLELPTNPVRKFQLLYCTWMALAIAWNFGHQRKFYRWFCNSGLKLATKRGLGAHPCKLYGLISPPRLTIFQFDAVGLSLIGCLLTSCTPLAPRVFLFLSFLLSLTYFPQLFAESTLSGHSSIHIPSVLLLLCCSPPLDHQVESSSEWPLALIRIHLASGYFSSGMCKLLAGALFNNFWGKGPTLQAYVIDGMWSRPATPLIRSLQRRLICSPWLLAFLSTASVIFETGFIVAPASDYLCVVFGLAGFAFHIGILVLQGLDFVTWWMPALMVFLVGVPATDPWNAVLSGWEHETGFFVPAAIYVTLQVVSALTLRDFWLEDALPFSCCPMFLLPRNPYDQLPKWWTMTAPVSGRTRDAGQLEPLYWSPASSLFEMTLEEAALLPQKVVWFGGCGAGVPPQLHKFIKPEFYQQELIIMANFELGDELTRLLRRFVEMSTSGELARAWDAASMREMLDLQQQCLDAFDQSAAAARLLDAKAKRC